MITDDNSVNCLVSDTDRVLSKDKFQRMLSLQQRLGDWELVRPGRELLKEGMLQKISRKGVGFIIFKFLSLFTFVRLAPATSSFLVTVCSIVSTRAQVRICFQKVKILHGVIFQELETLLHYG